MLKNLTTQPGGNFEHEKSDRGWINNQVLYMLYMTATALGKYSPSHHNVDTVNVLLLLLINSVTLVSRGWDLCSVVLGAILTIS